MSRSLWQAHRSGGELAHFDVDLLLGLLISGGGTIVQLPGTCEPLMHKNRCQISAWRQTMLSTLATRISVFVSSFLLALKPSNQAKLKPGRCQASHLKRQGSRGLRGGLAQGARDLEPQRGAAYAFSRRPPGGGLEQPVVAFCFFLFNIYIYIYICGDMFLSFFWGGLFQNETKKGQILEGSPKKRSKHIRAF